MERTEEQLTARKEEVATWLSDANMPTSPDKVTEAQLERYDEAFPPKTEDELAAEAKAAEEAETARKAEEDAETQKKLGEETAKATETDAKPKEAVVDPELEKRIALERKNAVLQDREDQRTAGQVEEKEYTVPEGLQPYLDKDLYDPAKKLFGGIELSDEMTITEKDDYDDHKRAYYKTLEVIETGKKDHAAEIEVNREAEAVRAETRNQFKKDYPDADINAIEESFKEKGIQYGEADIVLQIRQSEGETLAEKLTNWVKSKSPDVQADIEAKKVEEEIKAAAKLTGNDTELNSEDGKTIHAASIDEIMKKPYDDMTPEEKKIAGDHVYAIAEESREVGPDKNTSF